MQNHTIRIFIILSYKTCSDISAWHGAGYEPLVDVLGLPGPQDGQEPRHVHHHVVVSLGHVGDMATLVISPHITRMRNLVLMGSTKLGRNVVSKVFGSVRSSRNNSLAGLLVQF